MSKGKPVLKISQFQYPIKANKDAHSTISGMPLKSVREKIFQLGNFEEQQQIQYSSVPSNLQPRIDKQRTKQLRLDNKKTLLSKDENHKPELIIFRRYSYENYTNYAYNSPFKPKPPNVINLLDKPKNKPVYSYENDIQRIYCKTRFENFNLLIQDKLQEEKKQTLRHKRAKSMTKISKVDANQEDLKPKRPHRIKKGASTLANLIKEFSELQKLTESIQNYVNSSKSQINTPEIPLNKRLWKNEYIYFQVLVHRFPWLKNLHKRIKQRLLNALGIDQSNKYTQISLENYIDFVKIFIVRDAKPNTIAQFLQAVFVPQDTQYQLKQLMEILDLLHGSESKHSKIRDSFKKYIAEQGKHPALTFKEYFLKHEYIMNIMIDLFFL